MAGEMKWNGSTDWRYLATTHDDNLSSVNAAGKNMSKQYTKSHSISANLGVTGGWENVEWGFGVRTNNAANDSHATFTNNADTALGIEQAWFRYMKDFGSVDFNVTVGRQKNVFAYDMHSQQFFDNDVRWNGFGWQFKFGMFGLNAAQYVLGAKSQGANGASTKTQTDATDAAAATQSHFNTLIGFQPHMTWKFTDEIETMFAVGYYLWNDDSQQNRTGGGYNSATLNTGTPAPNAGTAFNMHNPKQWQFLNTWTLPYSLNFTAEYVMNKTVRYDRNTVAGYAGASGGQEPEADKSAFAATLQYGKVKKAHDWTIGYTYGSKGLASTINAYSNDQFLADNKGHVFNGSYALADNFTLGVKGYFLKEKAKKVATTGAAYAGTTANQEQKTSTWELTAGVNF